jgi:hypothetical protein
MALTDAVVYGPWTLLSMSMLLVLVMQPQPMHAFYVSYEHVPAYAVGERYVLYRASDEDGMLL